MKRFILITLFLNLSCFLSVSAQTNYGDYYFHEIEEYTTFEGGMDNFYKIVSKNLRSVDDTVGRVFVQFVVDTTGKTSEFKVVKGLSENSDKEVLRLMKWMSENYSWKPRLVRGQKVKVRMTIPIVFKEENKIAQNSEKFKIIVTEDNIKEEVFDFKNLDTTQIFMAHHFLPPIKIDYIEIERDTNNQEYLIYNVVENPPLFEGTVDNFYKIVGKNLKLAKNQSETGTRVLIEFVIDTTGKMTDFKILKSNFSEKNNAGFLQTLDWINQNYTWQPAIHEEKKVFFRMNLPIIIRLE
ncbi:Gram-negative bacterial tonB protein [Bernardetia litoralis DSM 6794]|uniref:Gram-negative bacterial tonB protein n=1 Tax=Bernardetia litoralis (strain ATCC 23117 / DSM 6794 / NBRC 15988 / NCIMB 1366 / Fx l1 / Sio-4) TaxID=880071 RepID=I4AJV3_BERLS|nr:energy transducer TonB [Bernardetia litoralis]AFM04238.1 Gram-negative bacterial tonB protein [Bernardetia litoralis DSM 6794]